MSGFEYVECQACEWFNACCELTLDNKCPKCGSKDIKSTEQALAHKEE